jgi:hypothetical protein
MNILQDYLSTDDFKVYGIFQASIKPKEEYFIPLQKPFVSPLPS